MGSALQRKPSVSSVRSSLMQLTIARNDRSLKCAALSGLPALSPQSSVKELQSRNEISSVRYRPRIESRNVWR